MTDPPAPASPSGPSASGIFSGCALAGLLHLLVSLVIIVIGGAVSREGSWAVFGFWLFLGLLQWIYLYPAIRFSRSRGWPGVVLGIWIAGGVTLALNLLQVGASLIPTALEKLSGNTPAHTEYSGSPSRVVSAQADRIVIRPGLEEPSGPGETETYVVAAETKFDFRGPGWRQQSRPAGIDWLKPGRQVSIDWVLRDRRKQATLVTIWVETPEP